MADDWSQREVDRALDRLDQGLGEIRQEIYTQYVRKDVYVAERDSDRARLGRLESEDTNKTAGNRNWLLGLTQTAFGAILAFVAAYMMTKGGHG